MTESELILYEKIRKVAVLTINRPDKAHAFSIAMLKDFHKKLVEADADEKVKCLLIRSTGERFFSAGYDLKEITGDPASVGEIVKWGRKINETIVLMKKPIISQVQGIAIGLGVLLILASDLTIFADRPTEELYLRLPEIEINAFTQTGATLLPLLNFGLNYAKNLLFTTDKVGVQDLKNINFPTRVFPLAKLEDKALEFAKRISKYQTEFLFFIKSMLTIMNKARLSSCFDLEDECGKVAYAKEKLSMKELDTFIKGLFEKYG